MYLLDRHKSNELGMSLEQAGGVRARKASLPRMVLRHA
jgi:hypothetical protein